MNSPCHVFVGSIPYTAKKAFLVMSKGTAKAPTVDLSRLNTLRQPLRKVMAEGGEKTKKNHARAGN